MTEQPTDYESPTGPLSEGDLTLLPGQTATLAVEEGGPPLLIPLGQRSMVIGRAADNDLVLASRFVSKQHARIDPRDGGHVITDLGSTNGLLYGGQQLRPNRPYPLRDGDVLRIGDPHTGGLVTLTYRSSIPRPGPAGRQQRRFPLGREAVTLGRRGCDITLDNLQVSRCHARIACEGDGHSFSDLGSTNGSFVNGRRVSGKILLGRGDIIQIGPFKLVYRGDHLDAYDQRGALQLDARQLMRGVGAGMMRRLILREVSLSIRPREFVAIVGGSGSGKSTLLMALAGVVRADTGSVLLNGDNLYASFAAYRQTIGYLPQDDILHPQLTVEQALGYAARLRLPADMADDEIARRIQRVLDDVDLVEARTTPIEQLSGGQRKRASIGVELLADPSLFFLDEPTSGLDPGLEKRLMYTLRRLADGGRTVVLVTHATANIQACDHVAFLGQGGRLVFFGPPHEALAFFGVSDFADIYTRLEGLAVPQEPWVRDLLGRHYTAWHAAQGRPGEPPLADLWAAAFAESAHYQRYIVERLGVGTPAAVVSLANAVGTEPRDSFLRQLAILTRRYSQLLVRDRRNLALLLLQGPIIGVLLLLLTRYDALTGSGAYASEARKVLFMLAMVAIWCGVLNAAREIVKERTIYRRERLASLRIAPYVLSKLVVLSGVVVVQSVALLTLLRVGLAFPPTGVILPGWAELGLTTLLAGLAGTALGLLISALARNADRALSLAPLVLIPQILFAGLIFRLEEGLNLPRLLSWLTISRWAMDAYGATVDLNRLPYAPGLLPIPIPEYTPSLNHLLSRWTILLLYTLACVAATMYVLKRQDEE